MLDQLNATLRRARNQRSSLESNWRDCYAFTLPQRGTGFSLAGREADTIERLFDGTAADGVEQLAASLLAELTPPWSQWFGLRPGQEVAQADRGLFGESLEGVADRIKGHFDRSNFAVEMHQALLDLATIGTATLMFVETAPGSLSAFQFHAVPAAEMFFSGDHNGQIRHQFRATKLTLGGLQRVFPEAELPESVLNTARGKADATFAVVEAVINEPDGCLYVAYLPDIGEAERGLAFLRKGRFERSPFITFRWMKMAGEVYGRSPVMTALPDIKTANKVVELVLKNASIAASGIWLCDDDGVINPANIKLAPGTIIPKAVGSSGLTPLQAPGRFDVSDLILDDLRSRIRHTLLVDRLGPVADSRMTATEVTERSAETSRLLGAVFGRLQAELVTPLVDRALLILRRRGEIPDIAIDGRHVELDYRSPLARAQARQDVTNVLLWLETLKQMGPGALAVTDPAAAAGWLARSLGVPGELVRQDRVTASDIINDVVDGLLK